MKRVERCYECGKTMRRLYIRESEVKAVLRGWLAERKVYKQQYVGFAWYCGRCKLIVFAEDGKRREYALVPIKTWEKAKDVLLRKKQGC